MRKYLRYIFCCIAFYCQTIHSQKISKTLEKFKYSVVKINTTFVNGKDENGFGIIVAERNNKLYILTAKHVLYDLDYRSKTKAVIVNFYSRPDQNYVGVLLNPPENTLDISLLVVDKPINYNWSENLYTGRVKKGTKVWFIGRAGQWYIPAAPGLVNEIASGEIAVDINTIQPGTSGAPLITYNGIAGLIFEDAAGVAKAYAIEKIIEIITKSWGYDWRLIVNNEVHEIHVGYVVGSIPNLGETFLSNDKVSGIGAISFGYRYLPGRKIALGAMAVIESFTKTPKNLPEKAYKFNGVYVMLDGRYYYIQKKKFQLYTGLNAGYGSVKTREEDIVESSPKFAFQVNLVGVRYGRRIGIFYDLGIGYRGVHNLGISTRL